MGVRAAAAVGQSAADRNLGSRGNMTAAVTGRSGQGQISVKLILIGAAILLSVGMGIRQSLGLFLTPMTRDLGIAFDGDGDRIGAIDGKGRILWGDQLLILWARDVLKDRPGATIIADVKASQALFDEVHRAGGTPLRRYRRR